MEEDLEQSRFLQFLFDERRIKSYAATIRALNSLSKYPQQLTTITANTRYQTTFVLGFDQYGDRVVRFLQNAPSYVERTPQGSRALIQLGNMMLDKLIMPLLGDQFRHLQDNEAFFELVITSLEMSNRSGPGLRPVVVALGSIPQLLAKLVTSERGEASLSGFLDTFRRFTPAPTTVFQWAEVLADLCATCEGSHYNQDCLERWVPLKMLHEAFHECKKSLMHNPNRISFSQEVISIMQALRVPYPTNGEALAYIIELVTNRLIEILVELAEPLPCRLCYEKCIGGGACTSSSQRKRSSTAGPRADGFDNIDIQFENLLGRSLGRWKISLSTQALKDLQTSYSEGNFQHIWSKLQDLATGDWVRRSVANPISIEAMHFKVRVFEGSYSANGRILWQVDQGFDERINAECQIVRVWRIGDVKEVQASYGVVARAQNTWSTKRVENCKLQRFDKAQGIKLPAILSVMEEDAIDLTEPDADSIDNRTAEDILISEKFHTLTTAVSDNIIHENKDAQFPFDITGTEVTIIKHFSTAVFILGRSGTGKTTCLLYKLLSRYLTSVQNLDDGSRLRQVLLTRSEPLSRKLKVELQQLIRAQTVTVDIPSTAQPASASYDDTKSLFSLETPDFPLVCTFSQFIKLLENTIRAYDRQNFSDDSQRSGDLVDFTIFKAAYWPKLGTSKGMDPGLVFSEIMGVIKGGGSSKTSFRPLSREEYITRSPNLAPAFPAEEQRTVVYAGYENYERMKKLRGDYDSLDTIMRIMNTVNDPHFNRRVRDILQEIYVDEVQDQRPLEIELLLHLVQNPRGIHFAGDSAQCISNDSAFRFANVKALFYEHYARSNSDLDLAKPQLFSLARNFRSHQGILSFASFIMGLLWKGFPNMVDKLSPEIGQYLGPRPTIFVGAHIFDLLQKAAGENSSGDKQIIIVRDETIQRELESIISSNSIVFTILQSKGMEYDDVYIYDFFSSSPYPSGWRSVHELLGEGPNLWYAGEHMTMCSELKNLYVAITRPRSRLWILESQSNSIYEMFTTKVAKPLVDVRTFTLEDLDSLMPELRPASATTPEEWMRLGEQCMDQKIYEQALRCFQNARDERNITWAMACIAEQAGREHKAKGELDQFRQYFRKAKDYFVAINMKTNAAECLEALGEFCEAAEIWSSERRHEHAARLFERAGPNHVERAASEYFKARIPDLAIKLYLRVEMYGKVVESMTDYPNALPSSEQRIIARKCNVLFRQGKISKHLKEKTFDLLKSDEDMKEFLIEYKYFDELWTLFAKRDKLDDALNVLMEAKEFDLLLKRASEAKPDWQKSSKQDLATIYNLINMEKLISDLASQTEVVIESSRLQYADKIWAQQWNALIGQCGSHIKQRTVAVKQSFVQAPTWCADVMSTIFTLYPSSFLPGINALCSLRIVVENFLHVTKNLTYLRLPTNIATCLGLIYSKEREGYHALSWSPMFALQSKELRSRLDKSTVKTFLLEKVENTAEQVYRKAQELLRKLGYCMGCVRRETWALSKAVDKNFEQPSCHQLLSSSDFFQQLNDLVKIGQMLLECKKNCTGKWMDHCVDFWVPKVVPFFCYHSSYHQDSRVAVSAVMRLVKNNNYKELLHRLQNTASEALKEEQKPNHKKKAQNLGVLFRNYKILHSLGSITDDILPSAPGDGSEGFLEPSMMALKGYHDLLLMAQDENLGPSLLMHHITELFQLLNRNFISTQILNQYDADMVSLYEDIGTLLLFLCRKNELLVPKSWTVLYLTHWETCLGHNCDTAEFDVQPRACQTLMNLTYSFVSLIGAIENRFQRSGNADRELLLRRGIDFIVIMLLNLGMMHPEPPGFRDLFHEVQKLFRFPSLKTAATIRDHRGDKLLRPLIDAFGYYNGKDHLCLYVCLHDFPASAQWNWLRTLGIQFQSMPSCTLDHLSCFRQPLNLRQQLLRLNAANIIRNAYRAYRKKGAAKRTRATIVIQRAYKSYRWRKARKEALLIISKYWKRYQSNNEYRKSAECAAVRKIQEVCKQHRAKKDGLTDQKYLRLSGILLDEGVRLYLQLEEIQKQLKEVSAQAKQLKLSLKYRDQLNTIRQKVDEPRQTLFQSSKRFVGFDLEEDKLLRRVTDALSMTEEVKRELELLPNSLEEAKVPVAGPQNVSNASTSGKGKEAASKAEAGAGQAQNAPKTKGGKGKKGRRGKRR